MVLSVYKVTTPSVSVLDDWIDVEKNIYHC